MNPLGTATYLKRNLGKTLPLIGVIVLAVMLVCGIIALINSIPLSVRTIYSYSQYLLGISPRGESDLTPQIRQTIEKESPTRIGRIATIRASDLVVKSIVGKWTFASLAMEHDDAVYFLKRIQGNRIQGRFPNPAQPEALITEPVARNLNLKIGSIILKPTDIDAYSPKEVKVVGIAQSTNWAIITDIDYYRQNHFPPIDLLLVFSKDLNEQKQLDQWAVERFKGERARVVAYSKVEQESSEMFKTLYQILDVVIATLVIVITIMMGMLINIHITQRTQEFGLLQALGYTKAQLLKRVIKETLVVVAGGWLLGIGVAIGLLNLVKVTLMDPNAYALEVFDPAALRYTATIPAAIISVAAFTLWHRFRTFDPVGVVERRLV